MKVILIIMSLYPQGYSNENSTVKYAMPNMAECLTVLSASKIPEPDKKSSKVIITCAYEKD